MGDVTIVDGNSFSDHRGTLSFVNEFTFPEVKRFYTIQHPDASVIRAWQGHKIEQKYFFASAGSFVIAWVAIDDWYHPSASLKASHAILSSSQPRIIGIPPGFANGIKALNDNAVLTIYSDLSLEDSHNDRWTFDASLWLDWSKF